MTDGKTCGGCVKPGMVIDPASSAHDPFLTFRERQMLRILRTPNSMTESGTRI